MSASTTTAAAGVWQALLPSAMVGTERHAPAAPLLAGAPGELLAQLAAASDAPALRLLRQAAVLAACEKAAQSGRAAEVFAPADAADPTAPDPHTSAAPADTLPALTHPQRIDALRRGFSAGPLLLIDRLLRALAASGQRVPERLLPAALEAGARSIALRESLSAVLGARGRWLARQNSGWRFAAGGTEQVDEAALWSEGSIEQRVAVLRIWRTRDAAAARERLEGVLPELPARERALLLPALAIGLAAGDEPLLESLLADRSREVRPLAVALLAQLPDSAASRRAIARIEPLLSQTRGLLRREWSIDAPQAAMPDWKADAIEAEKPKGEALGERAWWLHQLARRVPLGWWTQALGKSEAEVLRWMVAGDWGAALLRALVESLHWQREPAWCEALLDDWPDKLSIGPAADVLALLPLARRERYWLAQLRGSWSGLHRKALLTPVAEQITAACSGADPLSPELSQEIASHIERAAQGGQLVNDYPLQQHLATLCTLLDAAVLDRLGTCFEHTLPAHYALARQLNDVLSARRAFGI
jgi:Family of unknown function (DUF5691)